VLAEVEQVFAGPDSEFERLKPLFFNTGIDCRYSVRPYDWFRSSQGWPERSAAYVEGAESLFRATAALALGRAGLSAADVDAIITVSSTGIATPSIEARVMHEMGFRPAARRVPVFGLGCAGGATGLALAADLAKAQPGRVVLLVVIELCTLAFRADEMSKSNIVATALFGDGAAAAVLCCDGQGLATIEHSGEHCWPGSRDVMGWRIDREGFGAIFSRSIPDLVAQDLRPAAQAFLNRHDLGLGSFAAFTFHPGGAKVITALENAFELDAGRLAAERDVLRRYGNMSAPTVLFVLEEAMRRGGRGRRLVSALGPGFTASFVTMLH
jgi:alkylresorcinol/alkylpyrone synthase